MKADVSFLTSIFYPPWKPPVEVGVRKHRLLNDCTPERKEPVQARTKIMEVLDEYEWKTIDQLAKETSLMFNTVAITTDRMYKARKIERSKRETPYGKVNVFRKK